MYNEDEKDELYNKYDSAHSNFFILSNRIKMKLNVEEDLHLEIEKLIDQIELMLDPDSENRYTQDDIEKILKIIVNKSREVFKIEWRKSKRIFGV